MEAINKKILIIEDEKPLAHALELKLTHDGFEVFIGANGEDGLAILEKEKFALILLDLVMPKLDGFKVLERIKERKIDTPVAVLTNLSQLEDEKRARELGAVGFFVKSNTPIAEIIEWVKAKLDIVS
jgi:DNA-binding response OmpR family regulator